MAQVTAVTRMVAAPLAERSQQVLEVDQEHTFVDRLKEVSPLAPTFANLSGCAAMSVVWTSYPLNLRSGA